MSRLECHAGDGWSSAVAAIQDFWQLCQRRELDELIDERATELDRLCPIVFRGDLGASPEPGSRLTTVDEWVQLSTVTTDQSPFIKRWNGHKPQTIRDIINILVEGGTDENLVRNSFRGLVCNPNNRIELFKTNALGEPLHHVTNGNHRVHALRIMDVPQVPAIVWMPDVPDC